MVSMHLQHSLFVPVFFFFNFAEYFDPNGNVNTVANFTHCKSTNHTAEKWLAPYNYTKGKEIIISKKVSSVQT